MKKQIFFNGRFLSQTITGVQRTALELMLEFDNLIADSVINALDYEYILIHPPMDSINFKFNHIKLLQKGRLKGNLWEQIELPFFTRGRLLVSMCMISTLFKRKQIVIIHDACCFAKPEFFNPLFRIWYKFAIPVLGKIALKIVTVSQFSKHELNKYAKIRLDKIKVINNASNHMLRYGQPGKDFTDLVNNLKPYILAVSSLNPNKNFNAITAAISSIPPAVKIVIAGSITIKSFGKAAVNPSAHHLGYVSDSELKHLYENALLFIFPSFYEGFGIPPLEAMLLGCPVLSSNTSAMPEILADACSYCDPYREDEINEKLKSLISNTSKLSLLKQSGAKQAEKYSWTISAKELYDLAIFYS